MSTPQRGLRPFTGKLHEAAIRENARRDAEVRDRAEWVRRTLAEAPELTQQQCDRIAFLLWGGGDAA